jgi:D-alanyl-lipoteichoic acid acyltransferase DltB (MBOAT superfamily)
VLFNSFDFGLFLPIVFVLYWLIGSNRTKQQNILLLCASYFFYGIWDWRFLVLIFLSSIVDFYAGLGIDRSKKKTHKKYWLYLSVLWNLGVLFAFKYFNFFLDNLKVLFDISDSNYSTLNVIIPVGLSFYTFQTMSYTIDVYRKNIKSTNNLLQFLCFVSFFPQLVAGPIERAHKLLPQFAKSRTLDFLKAKDGLRQILWGLFKKVVVADNLGVAVSAIYAQPEDYSSFSIIYAAILFWFQLYCDFSGYADIAIGSARLLGFDLSVNFRLPYLVSTSTAFWRRWHITLSKWFQDYLFMPVVKWCRKRSISKSVAKLIAIFTTMTLMGFWHGANWTYIIFGALHGFLIIFESIKLSRKRKHKDLHALLEANPIVAKLYFIPFLVLGLLFFRSENVENAWVMIKTIFNPDIPFYELRSIIGWKLDFLLILILLEINAPNKLYVLENLEKNIAPPVRWAVYYLLIFAIIYYGGPKEQFIYFQF